MVVRQSLNDWSDKVFSPGYLLPALGAVAQYVREKGHLPGVPSATDVVRDGVDVARMDAKLLEKIEELTLYLIEQRNALQNIQKKSRQLEKENQYIKKQLYLLKAGNKH